jgi:hypothetical protein
MQERKSRNKSSRFSVLVALGLLLLLAFVSSSAVSGATRPASAATAPAVQITPNSGPYHTVTVVTGQGFAPHEQVAIYKQTRAFFAYETDATGSFVGAPHPLIGPGPLSGIITITGIGRTSGLKATTIFTVTP